MFYYTDPLSGSDVAVTDVSTAFYALKLANDNHFGVYHQGLEMRKELARNSGEIYNQKYALVEPYLPLVSDTSTVPPTMSKPTYIPIPLPKTVPQKVIDAMNYLDEQYEIEAQRLQAELTEDTADLNETIAQLEGKVTEWFKGEVQRRAAWLGGNSSATLSGCELHYYGGNVSFSYTELNN